MTKKEEQALLVFERNIFRRIYGPKYENGEWRTRTNRELEEMSKGENIVKWIKGQRISWLGHLERMEENRMPKMIFSQELEGPRRRGRPRKRWKEETGRGLRVLGVRRWRELATEKSDRILFDRPKPTAGCSANGRRRSIVGNFTVMMEAKTVHWRLTVCNATQFGLIVAFLRSAVARDVCVWSISGSLVVLYAVAGTASRPVTFSAQC
jgi:hypothetical protein